MARPERFELPTKWFEATYSIQLSYGRVIVNLFSKPSVVVGSGLAIPGESQFLREAVLRKKRPNCPAELRARDCKFVF